MPLRRDVRVAGQRFRSAQQYMEKTAAGAAALGGVPACRRRASADHRRRRGRTKAAKIAVGWRARTIIDRTPRRLRERATLFFLAHHDAASARTRFRKRSRPPLIIGACSCGRGGAEAHHAQHADGFADGAVA